MACRYINAFGLVLNVRQWAFPGWVGKGSGDPFAYPDLTANYTVNWVKGAKEVYKLDIDYLGRIPSFGAADLA